MYNFFIYLYGIDAFLYGLIVTSSLGTSLNIIFATREIGLSLLSVFKPILVQIAITTVLIITIQLGVAHIELSSFLMFLLKGISFLIAYLFLNWIFKIKSFFYIKELLVLKINRKKGISNDK